MNIQDHPLILNIQNQLGGLVTSRKDIMNVMSFFDRFPLTGHKLSQFEVWKAKWLAKRG